MQSDHISTLLSAIKRGRVLAENRIIAAGFMGLMRYTFKKGELPEESSKSSHGIKRC
jgi:hypothetical protein